MPDWSSRRGPPFRPPWWPEGEPFPPAGPGGWNRGPGGWHGGRRRFVRRFGLMLAAFWVLLFMTSALAVAVLSGVFGLGRHRGLIPLAAILGVLLLVGFVAIGRSVRRMARPLGDVMEAADRVAGGDYAVRVQERGPREMRRLARSFNQMTERLGSDEERRRNLLADVAHELRTPLSVILGNTEGMLDGLYPADPEHLQPLVETTRVMARLLDDLQVLSTAEAGALKLHREPVEPAHLVADAVAAFRSRAGEKGVRLEERAAAPGLPVLEVDPVRVGEVLSNLVANAVRHTPSGGSVTVSASRDGDDGVSFEVVDTGPGIPPEALSHVFERFVKSADSGGAGLGLAIAKTLVEAHRGTISAESGPAGGTTVRFTLGSAPEADSGR